MKLKPLMGYVLVEPIKEQQTTVSGMVLPDASDDKPSKGKVIAVGGPIVHYEGENLQFEECPVSVGDIVQHHKWAGQDVKEGQKEYRLVKFSDLMGVYET